MTEPVAAAPQPESQTKPPAQSETAPQPGQQGQEEATRFRLLGDLPSLVPGNAAFKGGKKDKGKSRQRRGKDKKKKLAKEDDGEGGAVPDNFKCAINGHLMRQPVRSPHGHVFEQATLLEWCSTHGSVCPITGDPLDIPALQVDAELSSAIAKWHVARAMKNHSAFEMDPFANEALGAGGDGEDDLYDF